MNDAKPPFLIPFALALLMLLAGPAHARLCMSDAEMFQKLGLNGVAQSGGRLRFSLPTPGYSGTAYGAAGSWGFEQEQVTGRIKSLVTTDEDGLGRPHFMEDYLGPLLFVYPTLYHNVYIKYIDWGTLIRAQVIVELEGPNHPVMGLVMLDKPECAAGNRAMLDVLLEAYEHNWTVKLGLLKGYLNNMTGAAPDGKTWVYSNEISWVTGGVGEPPISARHAILPGRLIYSVTVEQASGPFRPPGGGLEPSPASPGR